MTGPTYRCGWRYTRSDEHYPYYGDVTIRRGEFTAHITPEMFDDLRDEDFTHLMASAYREKAFEHLEAALDALAPLGRLVLDDDIDTWIKQPPPRAAIKAAVERWEAIQADKEPAS